MVGDLVWVRPANLPYWPAEVISCDESANRVRARLLDPPSSADILAGNLALEQRLHAKEAQRRAQIAAKKRQVAAAAAKESAKDSEEHKEVSAPLSETLPPSSSSSPSASVEVPSASPVAEDDTPLWSPEAAVVTASGQRVFFFDKLITADEVEACVEERLQRSSHNVVAYEADFCKAVLHANRLVRTVLSPERLKPYSICGIGVVHSLMRTHISAPRQPHTGRFEPQTAVIRLRLGLENAVRDLAGFEFIWVLFQFSYAAAMAHGEGQELVQQLRQRSSGSTTNSPQSSPTAPPGHAAMEGDTPLHSADDAHPAQHAKPSEPGVSSEHRHQQQQQGQWASPSSTPSPEVEAMAGWRRRQGLTNSRGFKTMIVPPRDDELRGVFATRSPHRPNFIGISCVRLVAVRGLDVHIADHDLLHGTPVLDIKPYLPFCDAHPDAKFGWVEELDAAGKGKGDHKFEVQTAQVDRIYETEE